MVTEKTATTWITDYKRITDEITTLENKKRELREKISNLFNVIPEVNKASIGNKFNVTIVAASKKTIKRDLLLANGVDAAIIDKSTDVSGYTYPRVSKFNPAKPVVRLFDYIKK